ncbi:hypothetical protein SteCoe_25179 [Stentor coeruleus]|uniref:Rubisco LSMT substrate-binding domain-containing protein n=1 Tax=Stentor coeruleus TaxID=5963 RepID=A0A1R2BFV2_9CILI|nr:hypothetical protein SteCoe_25179 [Stentor coeruleus]
MYKPYPGAEILQPSEEVQKMFDWAHRMGIKWPKIVYPVLFPPGYIGSMAVEDIFPGDAIVTSPNNALLTSRVAKESDLLSIFEENSSYYNNENAYCSDLIITSFLLYEKSKGPASKWYEFIGYQPKTPSNLQDWSELELSELQDKDLIFDTIKTIENWKNVWESWVQVMKNYPEKFTEELLSFKEFTWATRLIGTRTFGKFAPYLTFFPVGELLNHDNVESYYIYLGSEDIADSSKRYSGIINDEDHDGWIYEENPAIDLGNYSLSLLSYAFNDGKGSEIFEEIKAKAQELDVLEQAEEEKKSVYRPPDIDLTEKPEKEMRIVAGPNEKYEKGAEVYMSYGRYSNRQLLSVYGFSLKVNKYNFAIVKVPINTLVTEDMASKIYFEDLKANDFVKFKLKEKIICMGMISMIRKLWWKLGNSIKGFFKAENLELEVEVLKRSLDVLKGYLAGFPTSFEEDGELLKRDLPLRIHFAVLYRYQVKEIIRNQIEYISYAYRILENLNSKDEIASNVDNVLGLCEEKSRIEAALKPYLDELLA